MGGLSWTCPWSTCPSPGAKQKPGDFGEQGWNLLMHWRFGYYGAADLVSNHAYSLQHRARRAWIRSDGCRLHQRLRQPHGASVILGALGVRVGLA